MTGAGWQHHYDQALEGLQAANRDAAALIAAMDAGQLSEEQISQVMRGTLIGLLASLVNATLALSVAARPSGQLP